MNGNVQVSIIHLITQKCRIVSTIVLIPCTISNKITLEKLQNHVASLRLTQEENKPYVVVSKLFLLEIKKSWLNWQTFFQKIALICRPGTKKREKPNNRKLV